MHSLRLISSAVVLLYSFALALASPVYAQNADLGVSKIGPNTAAAGANVTYTVTVQNSGPDDAVNAVLTDTLPSGMTFVSETQPTGPGFSCTTPAVGAGGSITCSLAVFGKGSSATFSITVNIPAATPPGTLFINSVSVSSSTPDPNPENNTFQWGTTVPGPQADVYITKTGPVAVAPNSNISYTITVGNNGPDTATNVSWTDTLPPGVPSAPLAFVSFTQNSGPSFNCGSPGSTTTCTIGSLAAGASATFTFVGNVPGSAVSGTTYTNTASINSDSSVPDPNSENNSASTAATVLVADIGVTKSAPATAVAGGASFNYVITLTNNGPDAAQNARFNDSLPAGTAFVSITQNTGPTASCAIPAVGANGSVFCAISLLANGASAQFTVTVKATSSVANGTVLSNTVLAAADNVDSNPGNNSATASTTVSASSDVGIVKSGPAAVIAGTNATYTLTIANAGPSDAASASLVDVLPAALTFVSLTQTAGPPFTCTTPAVGSSGTVTCTRSSLALGGSATFSLVTTVSPGAANGSTVSNVATVASTTSDPTPVNNTSTSSAAVGVAADLAVTKTASYSGTLFGNIVYTLGITNNGPSSASAVQLSDTLPAGTHFVSLTQNGGPAFTCVTPAIGTGGTVNCSIAALSTGANAAFVLTVDTVGLIGGTLVNTATATSSISDPNPANNAASASVVLAVPAAVPAPALNWLGLLLLAVLFAAVGVLQRRHDGRL